MDEWKTVTLANARCYASRVAFGTRARDINDGDLEHR